MCIPESLFVSLNVKIFAEVRYSPHDGFLSAYVMPWSAEVNGIVSKKYSSARNPDS